MLQLDDMALFVDVVRMGGFRAAALHTAIPPSTISRRISQLEAELGLTLLYRSTRKFELTDTGRRYYERAREIVAAAKAANEEIVSLAREPSGTLSVALPVDFATFWLAPILPRFAKRYPKIDFEFDLSPNNVDLAGSQFDLAIRMGQPQEGDLISRVIGRLSARLYAAPAYVQENGAPEHPRDLEDLACLSMPSSKSWQLESAAGRYDFAPKSRFRINNVGMLIKLCAAGMGVILVPEDVVQAELKAGSLVQILPEWQAHSGAIHAVTESRHSPARTEAFIAFLKEELRFR